MAQWHKIANVGDIKPNSGTQFLVGDKTLAVFHVNGKYFAIDDACSHVGGNLSEGAVEGNIVTCPWHGATFDITCGKVLSEPASDDVGSYKIKIEGADILVEV